MVGGQEYLVRESVILIRTSLIGGLVIVWLAAPLMTWGNRSTVLAADQWTNLTGTSTVSGEMIGLWNGRVLLQLDSGRRVSVRMEDLRAESRIQAEKRLAEIQQRLQQRRAEIAQAAQEAEASAPSNAAELPPAPSYTVPPPGADLRTTLVAIRDQTFAGHLRVFYDTLPASHQQQIDELVALALTKLNTASFESARTAVHGLAELIVTRQRWLLSHPRLAQLPDDQQRNVIAAAELLRVLTSDEVMSLSSLRSRPFGESIARLDEALAPHLFRLLSNSSLETSSPFDFEIESGSDGVMLAKLVVPLAGAIGSAEFKSVEGRWVMSAAPKAAGFAAPGALGPAAPGPALYGPAALTPGSSGPAALTPGSLGPGPGPLGPGPSGPGAPGEGRAASGGPAADDGWDKARASLEPLPEESLRLPPEAEAVLQQFTAALAPLQQAATRREFHRALDELLPQIATVINQASGYQPPRAPGSAGAYGPSNLYGSENESLSAPPLGSSPGTIP